MKHRDKKRSLNEHSIYELWDNFKQPNIHVISVYVGEKRDAEMEKFGKK